MDVFVLPACLRGCRGLDFGWALGSIVEDSSGGRDSDVRCQVVVVVVVVVDGLLERRKGCFR